MIEISICKFAIADQEVYGDGIHYVLHPFKKMITLTLEIKLIMGNIFMVIESVKMYHKIRKNEKKMKCHCVKFKDMVVRGNKIKLRKET